MSELKAFTFGLGQYTENGSPCVVAFDGEKNPRLASDEKFYLKSEVDKVIADLEESHKKEVGQLLIEIVKLKEHVKSLILDNYLKDKEIRHHKYKQCMAMAKWSFTKSNYHYILARHGEDVKKNNRKSILYSRWHHRWNAIAEKFKEAK